MVPSCSMLHSLASGGILSSASLDCDAEGTAGPSGSEPADGPRKDATRPTKSNSSLPPAEVPPEASIRSDAGGRRRVAAVGDSGDLRQRKEGRRSRKGEERAEEMRMAGSNISWGDENQRSKSCMQ